MSRTLDSNEICGRALRLVGEFPTSETAPDGEQLREAMFWLDLLMASNAGLREVFHLQPATAELTLIPGQRDYSLRSIMGADWPRDGFSFPTFCTLLWPGSESFPIPIVKKQTISEVGRPDSTGVPRMIWIDRLATDQRLVTWPTLAATETQTYKLSLTFQQSSPDLSPAGVSGARPNGTTVTGLRNSWQEWAILKLAVRLGTGAINKQPASVITEWKQAAAEIKSELDAFENREHDTQPPICSSYGIEDYEDGMGYTDSFDSYRLPLGRYRGYLG